MTEEPDVETLRAIILRRYGSVHRFCRAHRARLNRATVYMVLRGTYPGNLARQARRIGDVLSGVRSDEDQVMEAIKAVACARCTMTARPCDRCDRMFRDQALAALRVLISGANFGEGS